MEDKVEKLNVVLIGDISANIDEGMKKITWHFYQEISKYNNVIVATPLELIKNKNKIKAFRPDILHYVTGPSMYSFVLLGYAKRYLKKAKTIVSATHPNNLISKKLISKFKPDLVLVQAEDIKKIFEGINIPTRYFPNGVDTSKFKPVNEEEKFEYRIKYGLKSGKFTLLHVGNLRKGRNLDFLQEISKDNEIQIILVTSTTIKEEREVYNLIKTSPNIKLIDRYIKDVQELYNASDVYIFPVTKRPYAVEVPLSVLEAMACNLPVITTKFAGLPVFVKEGEGLIFVENMKELIKSVYYLKNNKKNIKIDTRDKVLRYSWEKLGAHLNSIYHQLMYSGRVNE